jgi:hypothetical protein
MNWLVNLLTKEAGRRRFAPDDSVRVFTERRKGTGSGVVITPSFTKGRVIDYDPDTRRYRVWSDRDNQEIEVHPRNLVPDSVSRSLPLPEVQEVTEAPAEIHEESVAAVT